MQLGFEFKKGISCTRTSRSKIRSRWRICSSSDRFDRAEQRRDLFSTIVPIYDQVFDKQFIFDGVFLFLEINDVMSLGQHREWKQMCVRYSGVKSGSIVLDLCCGSGDLTQMLAKKVGPKGRVIGMDFSPEMLKIAREKDQKTELNGGQIEWIEGDALDTGFPQSSFDAITVGYGLRNVVDIKQALIEINRILKPGGRVSILDFNKSEEFFVDAFQNFALNGVVVPVAQLFGMQEEYKYLYDSIQSFPSGNEQVNLCLEVGFEQSSHYELASGLMGILVGQK